MADATVPMVLSTRGDLVETVHRGAAAVVDAEGDLLAHAGDPGAVFFVRSSAKPIQAVAAAEAGAFDKFDYTEAQIALAAASHSGEVAHIVEVDATLAKLGVSEDALVCAAAYPLYGPRRDEMVRAGDPPTRRHNNCSGKHCAMIAAALAKGEPIEDYWKPEHPHQKRILRLFAEMAGIGARKIRVAPDGCGVPNFALPLRNMALAFARLADPSGLGTERREACRRITGAMVHYPYLVGGSERFDTVMIAAGKGRWVCKGGALGYFAAGVIAGERAPALGLALKIESGDHQAACIAALEIFRQLDLLDDEALERLAPWREVPVTNALDVRVGEKRADFRLVLDK